MSDRKMGFCSDFGTVRVYCNRSQGGLWYTLDNEQKPVAIADKGLRGYIKDIKIEMVKRRGKESAKLIVNVEADKTYILESGAETNFSKRLILLIASMTAQQLKEPVVIAPIMGEDESVLFARIYSGMKAVKVAWVWDANLDWEEIFSIAIGKVRGGTPPPLKSETAALEKPWTSWKSEADALDWAVQQLPDCDLEELAQEWEKLQAVNGKKAPAWVERVMEMKLDF